MSRMMHDFPELVSDTLEDQLINKQRLSAAIKIIEDFMTGTAVHKASKEIVKRNIDIFIRREVYGETYNAIGARHLLSRDRIRQIVITMGRKIKARANGSYKDLFLTPYYKPQPIVYQFRDKDLNHVFNEYGKQKIMQVYRVWRAQVISMDHIDQQTAIKRAHRELDRVLYNLSVRRHERQSIKAAVIHIAKGDPDIKIYHREGSRIPYYAKIERDHSDGTSSITFSQSRSVDYLRDEARNFFMQADVDAGTMRIYHRYEYTDTPDSKRDELCLTVNYERETKWTIQ
jgi:hypothetical protein